MLCEIAWVIAGKRNTYLSAWYWRIKQKKGAKKAIVALARKLLVIIYTMLNRELFLTNPVLRSGVKTVSKSNFPVIYGNWRNMVIM